MRHNIHTKTGRDSLSIRIEPYWAMLNKGRHVGYRKTKHGGFWIARYTENRKHTYKSLDATDYQPAVNEANRWFELKATGDDTEYTLQDSITDYLKYIELEKSDTQYKIVKGVFGTIPDTLLHTPLIKLRTQQLQSWRDSFVIKSDDLELIRKNRNTANRKWSDLRAALNKSFHDGYISNDSAWRRIKPFKNTQKGRNIFFTDAEVSEIITQAKTIDPDFYRLCLAGVLTGARVGELKNMRTNDLDSENQCVEVRGKTGTRTMYINTDALELFVSSSANKTPDEYIFDFRGNKWSQQHHAKLFQQIKNIPINSCYYCLRHYYISKALITKDVTTEMVAKNVGTSIAMIEKFYGKFTTIQQKTAANLINISIT